MSAHDRLVIVSPVASCASPRGGYILTRKFIEGVNELRRHWNGAVRVLVPRADHGSNDLDHIEVMPADMDFELAWITAGSKPVESLRNASIVLATLIHEQTQLADLCASSALNLPIVYMSEYSLKTRKQIIAAEATNPVLRLRRQLWTTRLERRYVRAVKRSDGVQCNGTPTYDAYRGVSRNAILFFDSRVSRSMIATEEALARRSHHLHTGGAIRLAFSGRLIRMKGSHHLPDVAAALRRRNVSFTFDICGGGALEPELRDSIRRHHLEGAMRVRGVLDFERELMPLIREQVDLFVCCHPQGDPSCTYLETMACGTPIVGYANEAFAGIAGVSGVGWVTRLNDIEALADKIAQLARQPALLAESALKCRAFALEHTFEETMARRAQHLRACACARQVHA